ncbi:hypothetical protein ASPCAL03963 [Aspergillus calidoustus]|uniref:Carboxylesterase type B domain-containing protein n=1 Tax=Aspergillus calidoustus TaxID=454130 RepID=A0A0U5FTE7_ASPCI|nr:hypothetical protein ASPCAL03963 [Aspergillus calidoustus]
MLKPPVGDLRFEGPQSFNTTWQGARFAVQYSDVCMKYANPGYPMSEDCLSLNIIRPTSANASGRIPVAVWIHGGSSRHTNLAIFVSQGTGSGNPFIAVSINNRLNSLGLF